MAPALAGVVAAYCNGMRLLMDKKTPLVSIALCTYNGARFLPEQLDSLLAQTAGPLELVACDDGSTDETWDILRSYSTRFDGGAQLIRNARNLGVNANFEQALRACRGEWIAPCDQDDVWHHEKLHRLLNASQDAWLAYCDSEFMDERGVSDGTRISGQRRMISGSRPLAFAFNNCVSGHALIARRELISRALPVPLPLLYDWWLAFVGTSLGGLHYVDEPLVRFRRHAATVTALGREQPQLRRIGPLARDLQHSSRLDALASLASPTQGLMHELACLWRQRQSRWLTPKLAGYFLRHRTDLVAMEVKPAPMLLYGFKYFWGLPLKQSISSWRPR